MNKPLVQLAPNMATLLQAICDMPFTLDNQDTVLVKTSETSTERPNCLSALMLILSEQAEKDGFKIITINTEPKRIIMACNRQGKPQYTTPSTMEDGGSIRTRHSVRCGCRMRVNINFHTKIQAWRVTSFESVHNHVYGEHASSGAYETNDELQNIDPSYKFTDIMVLEAISAFRVRFGAMYGAPTRPFYENDAALLLQSLASSRLNSSSVSSSTRVSFSAEKPSNPASLAASEPSSGFITPNTERSPVGQNSHIPRIRLSLSSVGSVNSVEYKNVSESILPPPISDNSSLKSPGLSRPMLPPLKYTPNYPTNPSNDGFSYEPPTPGSLNNHAENRRRSINIASGSDIKNLAVTAIEIDRYAMLHSSFKKLIAIACKKREWTEDVLGHVGRMTERLASFGAPSTPLPNDTLLSPATTGGIIGSSFRDATSLPSPGVVLPKLNLIDKDEIMRKRRKVMEGPEEQTMDLSQPAQATNNQVQIQS